MQAEPALPWTGEEGGGGIIKFNVPLNVADIEDNIVWDVTEDAGPIPEEVDVELQDNGGFWILVATGIGKNLADVRIKTQEGNLVKELEFTWLEDPLGYSLVDVHLP